MPLFTKSGKRQILELPIEQIHPNPYQPRQSFEQEPLEELARSIQQAGILQPLSVRRSADGWELIAGERRLRAAKLAGLSTVPCLALQADAESSSLLALMENLLRADLDVWEEAYAIKSLIGEFHLSQEEVGQKMGLSQSAVANKLRILKLPDDIIKTLRKEGLSERHARALLRLSDETLQRKALDHIIRGHLTVAKAEEYIERLCRSPQPPRQATPIYRTRDVRLFLNTLHRSLGIMRSAGLKAQFDQKESPDELVLTVHISK